MLSLVQHSGLLELEHCRTELTFAGLVLVNNSNSVVGLSKLMVVVVWPMCEALVLGYDNMDRKMLKVRM